MKKIYLTVVSILFGVIGVAQENDLYPFEHSAKYVTKLFDENSKDSKISISRNGQIEITQGTETIKFDLTEIPLDAITLINDENNIPAIRFKGKKTNFLNISSIPKSQRGKLFNAFKNLQKVIIRDNKIASEIKDKGEDVYVSPPERT